MLQLGAVAVAVFQPLISLEVLFDSFNAHSSTVKSPLPKSKLLL
jgi:hypothetical protein